MTCKKNRAASCNEISQKRGRIINDDLEEVGKIMALIRIFKGYPA
jgi:hypothetical protein